MFPSTQTPREANPISEAIRKKQREADYSSWDYASDENNRRQLASGSTISGSLRVGSSHMTTATNDSFRFATSGGGWTTDDLLGVPQFPFKRSEKQTQNQRWDNQQSDGRGRPINPGSDREAMGSDWGEDFPFKRSDGRRTTDKTSPKTSGKYHVNADENAFTEGYVLYPPAAVSTVGQQGEETHSSPSPSASPSPLSIVPESEHHFLTMRDNAAHPSMYGSTITQGEGGDGRNSRRAHTTSPSPRASGSRLSSNNFEKIKPEMPTISGVSSPTTAEGRGGGEKGRDSEDLLVTSPRRLEDRWGNIGRTSHMKNPFYATIPFRGPALGITNGRDEGIRLRHRMLSRRTNIPRIKAEGSSPENTPELPMSPFKIRRTSSFMFEEICPDLMVTPTPTDDRPYMSEEIRGSMSSFNLNAKIEETEHTRRKSTPSSSHAFSASCEAILRKSEGDAQAYRSSLPLVASFVPEEIRVGFSPVPPPALREGDVDSTGDRKRQFMPEEIRPSMSSKELTKRVQRSMSLHEITNKIFGGDPKERGAGKRRESSTSSSSNTRRRRERDGGKRKLSGGSQRSDNFYSAHSSASDGTPAGRDGVKPDELLSRFLSQQKSRHLYRTKRKRSYSLPNLGCYDDERSNSNNSLGWRTNFGEKRRHTSSAISEHTRDGSERSGEEETVPSGLRTSDYTVGALKKGSRNSMRFVSMLTLLEEDSGGTISSLSVDEEAGDPHSLEDTPAGSPASASEAKKSSASAAVFDSPRISSRSSARSSNAECVPEDIRSAFLSPSSLPRSPLGLFHKRQYLWEEIRQSMSTSSLCAEGGGGEGGGGTEVRGDNDNDNERRLEPPVRVESLPIRNRRSSDKGDGRNQRSSPIDSVEQPMGLVRRKSRSEENVLHWKAGLTSDASDSSRSKTLPHGRRREKSGHYDDFPFIAEVSFDIIVGMFLAGADASKLGFRWAKSPRVKRIRSQLVAAAIAAFCSLGDSENAISTISEISDHVNRLRYCLQEYLGSIRLRSRIQNSIIGLAQMISLPNVDAIEQSRRMLAAANARARALFGTIRHLLGEIASNNVWVQMF